MTLVPALLIRGRIRSERNWLTRVLVAALRLRPKLMTGLVLVMGLAPILFSSGTGADVMKRIAAPMLGGVLSALILVLVVFPAIYAFWREPGLASGLAVATSAD